FVGEKVYKVETINKAAASIEFSDLFGDSKAFATTGATSSKHGLIVAKGSDNNYAIFSVKNGADTTIASTEVNLIATVDTEVGATNFTFA
ncbi:hypothetical protein, partial [Campylobacter sp.]|uniref:hypothetical protein n=1 Tax=Campylobacter sp. TaxID=205 RepID=UPI002AA95DBD